MTSEFGDLDDLLSSAISFRDESAAAKKAKEALKRGGQTAELKAETEQKIREWDSKHVWLPKLNVGIWEKQICSNCSSLIMAYSHVMQAQEHRTSSAERLIAVEDWDEKLPNSIAFQEVSVPVCLSCCEEFGIQSDKPFKIWRV